MGQTLKLMNHLLVHVFDSLYLTLQSCHSNTSERGCRDLVWRLSVSPVQLVCRGLWTFLGKCEGRYTWQRHRACHTLIPLLYGPHLSQIADLQVYRGQVPTAQTVVRAQHGRKLGLAFQTTYITAVRLTHVCVLKSRCLCDDST